MKASILRRALKNEIIKMCNEGLLEPQRGNGVMMIALKMAGLDKQGGGEKNAFTTPFTPPAQALAQAKASEPKDVESAKQAIRNTATGLKRYDPIVAEAEDEEAPPPEDPKKKKAPAAPAAKGGDAPPPPEGGADAPPPEKGGSGGSDPFADKGDEKGDETPPEGEETPPEGEDKPEEPEEPKEPEDPEQVPAEEDPEEKPLGKEEAKVIIKVLLKLNSKRNSQTIARLSKQIQISPKRIEDFVYALATKYVQMHVIRQKEK